MRMILRGYMLVLLAVCSPMLAGAGAERPNIVLIMADDMGYSDIGCYGGEIETPNIDQLAAEGMRFKQFYNASVCGPTRAALMTGLYHHQVGVRKWNDVRNDRCLNLGEALGDAGYHTMMVGKWTDKISPVHKGFDRAFGHLAKDGPGNYAKLVRTAEYFDGKDRYTPPEEGFFRTDAYSARATEYVREAAAMDQPFFLYVSFSAPHWPLHAREADIAKYRQYYRERGWDAVRARRRERQQELGLFADSPLPPRDHRVPPWEDAPHKDWEAERMAVYAAQVDRMDRGIGQVLDALESAGEAENTLVMFLSDNGATERYPKARKDGSFYLDKPEETWRTDGTRTKPVVPGVMPGPADTFGGYGPEWAHVSNTPLYEYKAGNYEGGILTPFVVRWPGVVPEPGSFVDAVGHVMDVMPAVLEIAGADYPENYKGREILPLEGKSLVPVFKGQSWSRDKPLFWEYGGHRAVRRGDWKLVSPKGEPWELYDLASDRGEQNNRAAQNSELVNELASLYRAWSERCNEGR